MTDDFSIRGAENFLRLSKALKETGEKELRKELHTGMRNAVKPLLPKAAQALATGLPPRLKGRGAKVKQVVQVKTGRDPGITIAVKYGSRGRGISASNARLINQRGVIRHPLFGDRERWFSTSVPGSQGWFDDTYGAATPTVRPEIEAAMQRVAEMIIRGARRG